MEEDEEGMIVVAGWKEDSAAAEHPSLMVGLVVGLMLGLMLGLMVGFTVGVVISGCN